MQGVFITGTGTDIGKTHVGAGIARSLKLRGINVIPRQQFVDRLFPWFEMKMRFLLLSPLKPCRKMV